MYRIDHILDRIKRRKIAFSKNDSIPLLDDSLLPSAPPIGAKKVESKNNDSIIDLTGEENITTEKITKENIHKSTNVSIEKNITLHYEKIEYE